MNSGQCTRASHLVGAVLGLACGAAPGVAQIEAGTHVPAAIDTPTDYPGVSGTGEPTTAWYHILSHPGATYVAIHFADFSLGVGDYLAVSDAHGGQEYRLTGRGKMQAGTFWARHVKGDTAVLQLIVVSRDGGRGFIIDEYVAGHVAWASPQALCGPNDRKNAVCYQASYPTEYAHGRPVARLLIRGSRLCSGALVSVDNHLLTNQHCIASDTDALNTDYEFMAEAPDCSDINCALCFDGEVFSGGRLVRSSSNLDYALVEITTGTPALTHGYLRLANRPAQVGERIYLPQHPGGRAKEFALHSTHPSDAGGLCRVTSVTEPPCGGIGYQDVGYYADTEGGSSGSPVLAADCHEIIALHHCPDCPNRGVPIDLIYPEIKEYVFPGPDGTIALERDAYGCSGPVRIKVRDGNRVSTSYVDVLVTTTGGDSENLVLTESPPASAIFVGVISIGVGPVAPGDGTVQVLDGETITATYDDADDGTGTPATVRDTAPVDCLPPVISNVLTPEVGPIAAVVTFDTHEPAIGSLRYGPSCDSLTETAGESNYATAHTLGLLNLLPRQTYSYAVVAEDPAGNTSIDDRQGACHAIVTPPAPVYFTEHFADGDNDLDGLAVLLRPNGTDDHYEGCAVPITALPTDPTGGAPLALGDDAFVQVVLAAGMNVSLHGVSYDTFYVGSNGYITFTAGDATYTESLDAHFALPRISVVFDDLNPAVRGAVSWQQFTDRAVVTWQEVVEYNASDPNTFQVEMYFDGRIRMAWLGLAVQDGLVGLSQGGGVPRNFFEDDLSALQLCRLPADFDHDGDVDLADFGHLQQCFTGPGPSLIEPACFNATLDADGDVDQDDVIAFQACMTGADIPADPQCAE